MALYCGKLSCATSLRALIAEECQNFVVPEIEAIATDVLLDIEREGMTTVVPCVVEPVMSF